MRILIKGIVQGVGFRPYIYRLAKKHRLTGFIRNLGTGEVEIVVQGAALSAFQADIYAEKPPLAKIDVCEVQEDDFLPGHFADFIIAPSEEAGKRPSFIPADVAICANCLGEMRAVGNRREGYYFTNCTDCGPRFTIIQEMPYDRPKTTMQAFPLCPACCEEYGNPFDRRYHAQPIACPDCGPPLALYDHGGEKVMVADPIQAAAQLIAAGKVLVVKGIGGMHLVMRASEEEPLHSFRRQTGRLTKPYAVMARDLTAVQRFALLDKAEETVLLSAARPIVLLSKSKQYDLATSISNLHTIGVMLPYTGLHHLLFDHLPDQVLVMTSANLPGLPMTKDNEEAFALPADYLLLHEREIEIPCDDSVVRVVGGKTAYLRRSRGFVPLPLDLPLAAKNILLALGAEQNTSACLVRENKAILTQYIGTIKNVETERYYRKTLQHFLRIFRMAKPELVVCDLHPQYETTNLARELTEEHGAELVQVQHHLAHFASVLAEQPQVLAQAIGLVCDGTGYGLDGRIWGGEVFVYGNGQFTRTGKLEDQPLLGGDLAIQYPARMALGILQKALPVQGLVHLAETQLPFRSVEERELLLHQLQQGQELRLTSSTGRVLDAIAALLGICSEMRHEGEPAMCLESLAVSGQACYEYPLPIVTQSGMDILQTTALLSGLYEDLKRGGKMADLAASAQKSLANGLVQLVLASVRRTGIRTVCCSGGVFYNDFFAGFVRRTLEQAGLTVLFNEQVGCGDNGLSLGQAYYTMIRQN